MGGECGGSGKQGKGVGPDLSTGAGPSRCSSKCDVGCYQRKRMNKGHIRDDAVSGA